MKNKKLGKTLKQITKETTELDELEKIISAKSINIKIDEGFLLIKNCKDKSSLNIATKGFDYFDCLFDLDQWLRDIIKYNSDKYDKKEVDFADKIRDKIREIMEDHQCSLEDII